MNIHKSLAMPPSFHIGYEPLQAVRRRPPRGSCRYSPALAALCVFLSNGQGVAGALAAGTSADNASHPSTRHGYSGGNRAAGDASSGAAARRAHGRHAHQPWRAEENASKPAAPRHVKASRATALASENSTTMTHRLYAGTSTHPGVKPMSATVTLQDTRTLLLEHKRASPRAGRHARGPNAQVSDSFFNDMNPDLDEEELEEFKEDTFGLEEGTWSEDPHYRKVWNIVKGVRRHKNKKRTVDRHTGVAQFFESTSFYEWSIFAAALAVFVPLYYYLLDWPSTTRYHAMALLIWLALGAVYNALVCVRLGKQAGVMWLTGYLLEFIFSIENVFVFHIVVKAFRTPRRLTQKALFVVICCQIVFEMTFFMGLADQVRSMVILPYALGVWLLYVGYHASLEEGSEEFNIKDSLIFRLSEVCFGQRLSPVYDDTSAVILIKGGRLCVSLLFPLICCLLAVDFVLEVDVTLTKIEEIPNEYIAFTSSATAAFAAPELFFVARDLFQRYHLLKYGISFVLVFFGMQMLLHRFFEIPDLVGCAIIIMVMILCMIASDMHRPPAKGGEVVANDAEAYKNSPSWPPTRTPVGPHVRTA